MVLPFGLYFYFRKHYAISRRTVWVGVLMWIVFAQILEAIVHIVVLPGSSLLAHPFLFAVYGALAAGVFEEIGRYVGFNYYLKENREWKDGVAYGIGHGGAETVLLGAGASLELVALALLSNAGKLTQLSSQVPPDIFNALTSTLHATPYTFLLIGVERIFAIIFHIALSLIVLLAVRKDNVKYLWGAILLHAFLDFPAGLYQAGATKMWVVESIAGVCALALAYFIVKAKSYFNDPIYEEKI